MEQLIIDRKKWLRGRDDGVSQLRRKNGMKCCLGFDLLRRGLAPEQITDHGTPFAVASKDNASALKGLITIRGGGQLNSTTACHNLMSFNDDPSLRESERERLIRAEFKQIGVRVKFIN